MEADEEAARWAEALRLSVRWARRYANPVDAEDIAQDALVRAWRHRARVRDDDRFLSWLSSIVRNEALRAASQRRCESIDTRAEEAADDERLTGAIERLDVERCLGGMGDRDRLLLRLRYEDDLTQSGIAEKLGVPEGTVKVQLHRARERFRRELEGGDG